LGLAESAEDLTARSEGGVTLSSIHQAKGLEWKAVFLIWLAEGMFPGSRSLENPEALEEERRLFYVGLTRCKDDLYLSYPQLRLGGGYGEAFQRPSRFVEEIPKDTLELWKIGYSFSSVEDPF
jgi:DNA helicase-2/ATP-dependent DNA helicase PcrA